MILHGDIRITSNIDEVNKLMFTHRIIFIGEPIPEIMQSTNAISASLFIPPYEIIMSEMDGKLDEFVNAYVLYLNGRECSEYIALIIRALYEGTNILLYLSKDESETLYSKILLKFLNQQYGIVVSIGDIPSMFIQSYSSIICNFLYSFNLMSAEEFFLNYPDNKDIEPIPIVINRLVNELNPYVTEQSLENYCLYFNNLKQTIKQNNNRYLTSLIQLEK